MALFVKIVPKRFDNENRDKRELSVIKELGHEIIVISKGDKNEVKIIDGYNVHCRTTRPIENIISHTNLNRIVSIFTWSRYIKKLKPECISGHDLTGILIGWLSTIFIKKDKKPLLVYDAHEFEIGRCSDNNNFLYTKMIQVIEKFILKKCTFSIMVNDSIADEVQKLHGLKGKPIVVRNIPPKWHIDKAECEKKKKQVCNKMGIKDNSFIIMYHGGITRNRGIENLISSVEMIENTHCIIMGYGEENYINELKNIIEECKVEKKVHFLDAVPLNDIWRYVGFANVGVTLAPNTCKNHYFMLPNKLFENIQSLTPVIGSSFLEIKKIVEGYNIGLCCDPHNINDIRETIEKIKNDESLRIKFHENLLIAKEELCWENEKNILLNAYKHILN